MAQKTIFLIDFDSTFTKVEALDILCDIAIDASKKDAILQQIQSLTNQAMEGTLGFGEALEKRLTLLDASKSDVEKLIAKLKTLVSESVKRNKSFFEANKEDIYIISSGFKDFIVPVVADYGIAAEHVYANTFTYDSEGNITGADTSNPLSGDGGKIKVVEGMNLEGDIVVVGDGFTDYEIRQAGLANDFFAFTENVSREKVVKVADHIAPSFDEILYVKQMKGAISYPKNRIKVLLLENVHKNAVADFENEGFSVEFHTGAMDEEELCEKIKNVSILGIRSKTNVTRKVLENANKLIAIGTFCIGTNQVDLGACLDHGVAVFNAPYSNTRSVVELAIGEIIMLMRNLPDKIRDMHNGKWTKSASKSFEVRGKKLGIIGYGSIGAQLSVVAESLGMEVYFYDLVEKLNLGNATRCKTLQELLETADVVSLHIDGRKENKLFFGKAEFDMMKEGAYFLNLARGPVVEVSALAEGLKSGRIAGAGIDVFPEEPKNNKEPFESELIGLPNLIITPHIGGSTLEAQVNIAEFVPAQLMGYINTGSTFNSVNFPKVQLPSFDNAHRLLHIHKNVSGVMAKINQVYAKYDLNIVGQYLKTNEEIGYVITDINTKYSKEALDELRSIENTIKFRVLY